MHSQPLTPYADALALIREHVRPLPAEVVALDDSLGRFLAEPARAASHSPRFEQSAMDGFAVRMDDVAGAAPETPVTLDLVGELAAGDDRRLVLKPGQTAKVYTGSRLPGGTEAVVMKEYVTVADGRAGVAWKVGAGDHIRRVGEEYRRGDEILPAGTAVTPPVVGMLAMLGRKTARVGRRPRAAVVTMGDELVAPGEKPGTGQIPDANGPALVAALRALGAGEVIHRRVGDDADELAACMEELLGRCDILVTAGGASVGDHDHVGAVRERLGVPALFSRLAIKPGKPNFFGLSTGGVPVFGLPGNPVSALVSFHRLVRPAVRILMGGASDQYEPALPLPLVQAARKTPGRMEWQRAQLTAVAGGTAAELDRGQGSHMLSGLARADVLVELPRESDGAAAGETIVARWLSWRF